MFFIKPINLVWIKIQGFVEMQTGREHFRKLVDDNEYQKITELWVNGKTIDWKSLQHEQVI